MSTMTINTMNAAQIDVRPLRLTRRGKAVVLSAAASAIGILAVVLGPSSTATNDAGSSMDTTSVRIMPGHTLWEIAGEANPHGDIRNTVDEILELNAMPNASDLQVGSQIAVPVYSK